MSSNVHKHNIITAREFTRNVSNFGKLAQEGQSFIVTKNGEDQFIITPPKHKRKKKYTIHDLAKFTFSGGDPNMSKDIDTVLYDR